MAAIINHEEDEARLANCLAIEIDAYYQDRRERSSSRTCK